jgi:hypothetical protein
LNIDHFLTLPTSERAGGNVSRDTFLKSVRSNKKYEVCHSFLVKIFTKSLHRGSVRLVCHHSETKMTLTGTMFETGAYGVPSKSQKSFICGGVRQTITLTSPGKGADPLNLLQGAAVIFPIWMQYYKPSFAFRIGFFFFFLK